MPHFIPEEIDASIQQDLKDEITELYEASEQCLIELELTPDDKELQRALFRSVHTIKGDLGLVGFAPMISVLQDLEDVLDLMRKDEIHYTSAMQDLVLGMLDLVNDFVNDCIESGKASYRPEIIDEVNKIVRAIKPDNEKDHETLLTKATQILKTGLPDKKTNAADKLSKTGIPKDLSPEKQEDLLFFRELMRPIEKRTGRKEGKGDRLASLALYINSLSDRKIPEDQLAVACYVHDFGMSFMPQEIVKKKTLSALENNLLRSHVYKSTRLIEHLNAWDEARKIVMQHHENEDGTGYPLGIEGDQICEGAKLLSILDKYDDLLYGASEIGDERTAIVALNKQYKGKLSNYWLRLFNQTMAKLVQ